MAGPRIAELHVYHAQLPVVGGPYVMARASVDALDSTLVKIVAENGLVGWGECCPVGPTYQPEHALGARAALAEFGPGLVGRPAAEPLSLRREMDARLNGHNYAKAAVDIAAYDLMGKLYGAPVSALLGGAARDRVPSYFALGVDAPEETGRLAAEKAREGYRRLQVKLGGRAVAEDIAAMRCVAEVVDPGVRLAADGNRGWTSRDALLFSAACAEIPLVLEQPCNTIEETAAIRPQLRHPVYLDESSSDLSAVLRAIALGVCDGFGFKVTRLGGLSAMAAARDVCAARSMPHTCDDAWGGDVIAAACAHLAATVEPRLLEGVWIAEPYIDGHYDARGGVRVEAGEIQVPQGPGLGLEIEEAALGAPAASYA